MTPRPLAALAVVALLAVGAGCGDDSDDSTETGSGDPTTTTTTAPGSPAPGGGSLPDRPADLTGEVTDSDGGRVLVEEQPGSPDTGRKAWVAIEGPVFARQGEGEGEPAAASPSDVEVGQQVSAWTGICAESYPEQCAAEALVIE